MYSAATARLDVEPGSCLYVGDGGSHELSGAAAVGMTPVKLAAADLKRHLVFRPDPWQGSEIATLTDVLDIVAPPAIPAQRRPSTSVSVSLSVSMG